ncbi:MAG: 4-hydroxy-tetrahydrodipicolinate reductase [Mitsuokella jalaludinii]|uniref:4-hydroxy-tetrahydrodipicolinate reductase n=1 Tax=Mitsuokella TaxID=52225 RepID=UPI0005608E94|nr:MULTISPECIES: 4-hydroxy-tetrahydrodipicolinate reductase [Mitsuokella]MCI6607055.1 4-hydroxy-tetrahydrodipicolinate reductase [Mitsuokella jalaludinii]MCI6610944.1 4-hydroxy-tetrahydrodipicolinate reductase [Mitsuokella jalaludinii]MCI7063453.1 4-hydroxy-tetrahydrodipicolinate reductase [Mitsuokella jalaludinii]MCI7185185.1 4-hydroxy-tetrahydrodipicolinate reductase [Mitsuokella jalaludinii]MCQ1532885.1 4-hydroxy-tetrahydrodipicolinate reductase [Mitsuokella jalaludinii]
MTTVIVNGACGRMGQAVLKAVQEADGLELVGAVDIKGGADTGSLVGLPANGILVETDLEALLARKKPEVMVDFTRPDVVFGNVMTALAHKTSPVVGTTGLSDEQKAEIAKAAEENDTPAFIAPNFAIGAVLLMVMSRQAAKYMPDVEIIELHHDKKLDAPSGTAIQTAAMIAEVRKAHKQGNPDEFEKLEGARGADYEGMHIHSVRLPGYVAHQEVIFGGLGQTLTIRHDSMNRESFMPGVVLAAKKVRSLKGLTVGLDKLLD